MVAVSDSPATSPRVLFVVSDSGNALVSTVERVVIMPNT